MIPDPIERTWIAEYVMKNNLPIINAKDKKVVPKDTIYTRYVKRIFDIIIALVACVLTLPINIIIGICTFFDVGRPIFFLQKRPGKDGKEFTIVKFRNMRNAKDKYGVDLPISERVTKFGSFVRKTSLDELLNFYSILKGDMSIIGPRPLASLYLPRYSDRHMMRHHVRPGLECPNIQMGGYSEGWHEKLENDVWYVENVSFLVDLKMIFFLFRMVFDAKTRKKHAVSGPGDFIGYDENGIAFGLYGIPQKYIDIMLKEKENGELII